MLKAHRNQAVSSVKCKIVTVSDTRTKQTDKSGQLIEQLLEENGHQVVDYVIVLDEPNEIKQQIQHSEKVDVIITNGGTGISKRDVTIETIEPLYEKELTGFGEIFRMKSYLEDIGSAAILSRASAGIVDGKAVFSIPGSTGAVKLALESLILLELGHIVGELRKDGQQ
ncbi:MogA/MoaB family molybdenum cofactor biosynthesis protein [Bacillus carboniphilus]|uniref:Molybdenum cofactor biosynthesis protein B n=1 Tax=Bacillus carboniphilus TaxID=86663 RepID=A0ABY9JSJ8_9BACI|nr:MogA/MoaB family molybdenum cofactor biosynthesis protein [Bacillus carboniphilus]WLR41789.1 MogA/MoaB family molybdenum cofactor biosynthesis protein [Bacillus carboniphilus]